MRRLLKGLILCFGLLSLVNLCYSVEKEEKDKSITWLSYKQAMKLAQSSEKYPVLFFTGSNWCIWCLRMEEEILSNSIFIDYAEKNFLMVKVDFPMGVELSPEQSKENDDLKLKYEVTGYPTLLILDKRGKVLIEDGYMPGGGKEYVMRLKRQLEKVSKN